MECGSEASAYAEAALQHPKQVSVRLTPSHATDKGTPLEFTVCGVRTLFRPHPQLIRVHRSGTKKVPLGVNLTHYDNTQTAQHGRRVPDRNANATPPTRTHTYTTRPHPLAPVRPHRARNPRPNPRLPLPRPTHPHRPQHLATTPQTPPTTALPRTDALSRPAAPCRGMAAPARSRLRWEK